MTHTKVGSENSFAARARNLQRHYLEALVIEVFKGLNHEEWSGNERLEAIANTIERATGLRPVNLDEKSSFATQKEATPRPS